MKIFLHIWFAHLHKTIYTLYYTSRYVIQLTITPRIEMSMHDSITLQKLDFNFQNKREKIKMFFQSCFFSVTLFHHILPSTTAIVYDVNRINVPMKMYNGAMGVCKNDKDDVVLTIKLGSMVWMCITEHSRSNTKIYTNIFILLS